MKIQKITTLLLILAAAFSVTACGDDETNSRDQLRECEDQAYLMYQDRIISQNQYERELDDCDYRFNR